MKAFIVLSFSLLALSSCSYASKKTSPPLETRTPSSRCESQWVSLEIKEPVFIPAYDKDGKTRADVGTSVVYGKTASKSSNKLECTFYNESGQELSLKKGTRLEMTSHFRPWGVRFYDPKAQVEVSCSEEGLDPKGETVNWGNKEVEVINLALAKKLRFQSLNGDCKS